MRLFLAFLVVSGLTCGSACAEQKEELLRFNSRCIRAHADHYDYIPSKAQSETLDAASGDPGKVLELLIGYVLESHNDIQRDVLLGASNPKLSGLSAGAMQEVVASFREDEAMRRALLRELRSIEIYENLPGSHGIKGKGRPCPHRLDGGMLDDEM
jgi:hypothetical protein